MQFFCMKILIFKHEYFLTVTHTKDILNDLSNRNEKSDFLLQPPQLSFFHRGVIFKTCILSPLVVPARILNNVTLLLFLDL